MEVGGFIFLPPKVAFFFFFFIVVFSCGARVLVEVLVFFKIDQNFVEEICLKENFFIFTSIVFGE